MSSSTFTYAYVTIAKTPLKRTYTMSLIEIIRTTLYYALYAGITLPLLALLLSTISRGLRDLRAWAQGEEGVSPDAEK